MSSFRRLAASAVVLSLSLVAAPAFAQVSLTTLGTPYTQTFDTLPTSGSATWTNTSTIPGWFHARTGTGTTIVANDGSSNAGNLYSYGTGTATDRALGSLGSGNAAVGNLFWGVRLQNNTGATITSLDVTYTGEQWRNSAAAAQTAAFSYLIGSPTVTGTLAEFQSAGVAVTNLDFTSPITGGAAGALNGNLAANRVTLTFNITGLSIPNGTEVMLRWSDPDHTGADHGLSIDDFQVTPQGGSPTPTINVGDISVIEGNAGTATLAFPVTLTSAAGSNVTFTASTQDNSASLGDNDYVQLLNVPFTITTGNTSTTVNVTVNGDLNVEPTETLFLNIANITNANPGDLQGLGTITTDDFPPLPNLTINDVTLAEGNAGTTTFTFTVSLSQPAGPGGVTFDIATADGTAQDDNPVTEDNDYVAQSLTGQTIPAGSSTYAFNVLVNGDTVAEPNETFFVNVTNVTNATAVDTQGLGTINNEDVALTAIHDIQGPGAASPLSGSVTTRGIVTGRKSNGFFIQEPDATVDADPATSEGILIFTSSAPPAAAQIGNLVQVTGTIAEFVPTQDPLQPPLTELTSPTTTLITTGNPLPAAIPLTATFPDPAGPVDQLERVEGMRVSVASATAVSGTGGTVNEPNATSSNNSIFSAVVTGVARPFREPGIQANDPPPSGGGTIPPIPRWDFNPELFQVDADAIGSPALSLTADAVVTGLVGPLDYGFRRYTILPDPTAPAPIAAGGQAPTAVTVPTAQEFTVATYNLERFFDTVDDPGISDVALTPAAFSARLTKASLGIRNFLRTPDILGVVEVENLTTLQALATQINNDAVAASQPNPLYTARLVEGNDIGGIDVGFLIKQSIVTGSTPRVTINAVVQEKAGELFVNADASTELLNDRPSLRLDAVVNNAAGATFPVTVIVNHLRSLNNSADEAAGSNGWPTAGARVRAKRQKQAESLADIVQVRQLANPSERIILVGDFNAFEFNDGLGDSVGVIRGVPSPDNTTAVPGDGVDLVNPDFTVLLDAAAERYSFLFGGNAQSLDHVMVNTALVTATTARRVEHARINADFAANLRGTDPIARLADHDPIVSYYTVAGFQTADVSITKTDTPDPVTAGTNLTYTVTVTNAGPDPAVNAAWSDTLPPGTTFVSLPPVAGWACTTGVTINCTNPSFAVGSAVFTLTVAVAPTVAAGTVLSNTANATSTTGDPNTGNNSATATTTVATSADVSITKTDTPDPVTAGTNLTYTITATNGGPSNAANAGFTDTLPAGTTFVSLPAVAGWSCTTGATVTCTNPSFAPGNAVFTLTVAVAANVASGTVLSNTANISSTTSDPVSGNNSATATTTVNRVFDLAITHADTPDPVAPGGTITYTTTVTNTGPSDAGAVTMTGAVSALTTFVSLTAPAGWTCTTPAVGASGPATCDAASFAPGASAVFTLVVGVPASTPGGTVIGNIAGVIPTTDANPGNNVAQTQTTVSSPSALSATKTASGPRTPGSTLTYTIVVRNNGTAAQNDNPGNELIDVLPAGLTLVSATASSGTAVATVATNTVTWNGAIAAGASVTITITATITAGPGTSIVNQATINFDGDGNGTNESTVVSDDPGTGAAPDPTGIVVLSFVTVPVLSPAGLFVMLVLFGLLGLAHQRRRVG